MSIIILAVGKLKGGHRYLQEGVADYLKRIGAYRKITIVEIAEETIAPTRTDEQIKTAEGERILSYLARFEKEGNSHWVGLSDGGESLTSPQFAARCLGGSMPGAGTNQPNGGTPWMAANPIIFLIGGPLGLSQAVLTRCHSVLSLSSLTFTHPMVRLFLVEQLYRAFKIHRNEPYHK